MTNESAKPSIENQQTTQERINFGIEKAKTGFLDEALLAINGTWGHISNANEKVSLFNYHGRFAFSPHYGQISLEGFTREQFISPAIEGLSIPAFSNYKHVTKKKNITFSPTEIMTGYDTMTRDSPRIAMYY